MINYRNVMFVFFNCNNRISTLINRRKITNLRDDNEKSNNKKTVSLFPFIGNFFTSFFFYPPVANKSYLRRDVNESTVSMRIGVLKLFVLAYFVLLYIPLT